MWDRLHGAYLQGHDKYFAEIKELNATPDQLCYVTFMEKVAGKLRLALKADFAARADRSEGLTGQHVTDVTRLLAEAVITAHTWTWIRASKDHSKKEEHGIG